MKNWNDCRVDSRIVSGNNLGFVNSSADCKLLKENKVKLKLVFEASLTTSLTESEVVTGSLAVLTER